MRRLYKRFMIPILASTVKLVVAAIGAGEPAIVTAATETTSIAEPRVLKDFGRLPLQFEKNEGQSDERVKFLSRGRGYTLFLTADEAVLSVATAARPSGLEAGNPGTVPSTRCSGSSAPGMVRMRLLGANRDPEISGLDELPGKVNYFVGKDPERWRTNLPTYRRVLYKGVYPGIDLLYYGNQQQLEYDIVVAPGANPDAIKLAFQGATDLRVSPRGDLVLATPRGEIRLGKPLVYQEGDRSRRSIEGQYALTSEGHVRIALGAYNRDRHLVIDPVLVYSTYLGGNLEDEAWDVAVDSSGSAYIIGGTASVTFPTTNPQQPKLGPPPLGSRFTGGGDAFVAKLSPSGLALVYSTYLGGSVGDLGRAIAVDVLGNAYVAGNTYSSDFPTVNAYQETHGGGSDGFVAKLDSTGSTLLYSTYLGGYNPAAAGVDVASDIAVDAAGNAVVVGSTASGFPTTSEAFQPVAVAIPGCCTGVFCDPCLFAAFAAKFSPTGQVVYSTLLNGAAAGNGVALDSQSNACLTGKVTFGESIFPSPALATDDLRASYRGSGDAFVAILDPSGSNLLWVQYLGGSESDSGESIAVDPDNNIYVAGLTKSSDFPTNQPLQPSLAGGQDVFVAKLGSPSYATFLGGTGEEWEVDIIADEDGNAYVAGGTLSTDFPVEDAFQADHAGGWPSAEDAFVAKLDPAGSRLLFSSFLGGTGLDTAYGLDLDDLKNLYVVGETNLQGFPTFHPMQPNNAGYTDAFITKIATTLRPVPLGIDVTVQPLDFATGSTPVTVTFSQVTEAGAIALTTSANGPSPPAGFAPGNPPVYYEVATTALHVSPIQVCIEYTGTTFGDLSRLSLFHLESGEWMDRTMTHDAANSVICASVPDLSPFAIFERVNQPPVANAGLDQSIESASPGGTVVTLDGSGSTDPDDDPLTYTWTGPFPEGGGAVTGEIVSVTLPLGAHTISLEVDDGNGGTDTDEVGITIDLAVIPCDANADGQIDITDIQAITQARNSPAEEYDPRDVDGDGMITALDARQCVMRCTNPRCAP